MKKFPDKKGLAIAGLILGIIGTVYGLISLIACGLAAAAVGRAGKEFSGEMKNLLESAAEEAEKALE